VTDEEVEKAIEKELRRGPRKFSELAALVSDPARAPWMNSAIGRRRIVDKALQRMRKAGKISLHGDPKRWWHWEEEPPFTKQPDDQERDR